MDEKEFQHVLHIMLEKEIPNVNLLNRVISTPRARRRSLSTTAKTAMLIVLLMSAIAAYAYYQSTIVPSDPGIARVAEDELLTYIQETQPITGAFEENNLSVTLDFAYADINRITVGYTVSGEATDDRLLMAFSNPTLMTSDGQPINRLFLSGNLQDQEDTNEGQREFSNRLTSNFTPNNLDLIGLNTLELRLIVDVAVSDMESGEYPSPQMEMAGQATFAFEVPLLGGTVIEVDQSATDSATDVEVQQVAISPSTTIVKLCYELPPVDSYPGWTPFFTIRVDNQTIFSGLAETFPLDTTAGLNSPCRGAVIPQPLEGQTGEWHLDISEFRYLGDPLAEPITGSWQFIFSVE